MGSMSYRESILFEACRTYFGKYTPFMITHVLGDGLKLRTEKGVFPVVDLNGRNRRVISSRIKGGFANPDRSNPIDTTVTRYPTALLISCNAPMFEEIIRITPETIFTVLSLYYPLPKVAEVCDPLLHIADSAYKQQIVIKKAKLDNVNAIEKVKTFVVAEMMAKFETGYAEIMKSTFDSVPEYRTLESEDKKIASSAFFNMYQEV
jgi:hypothetical protein